MNNNHSYSKNDHQFNSNLFKYFFSYDFLKFQQFISTISTIRDECSFRNSPRRKSENFTKRRRHRNTNVKKRKTQKINVPGNIFEIKSDLDEIKRMHLTTDSKVEYLVKDKRRELEKGFSSNSFHFEIIQNKFSNDQMYDYFSFKIKPDMSLNSSVNDLKNLQTGERNSLGSNYKKMMKCHSPDRLISHKFFEDTEHFRNSNLMSVKTFLNNHETTPNPFSMTNKSDSEISPIDKYKISNIHKLDKLFNSNDKKIDSEKTSDINEVNENIEENKHINTCNVIDHGDNSFIKENDDMSISITNYSEREIESGKKRRQSNLQNLHASEEEGTIGNSSNIFCTSSEKKAHPLKKMNTDITYTSQTMSDNNDTVSMNSSKFNVECSQEKFKKVRGFNFKNNINTKKYTKPLFNAKAKSEDKFGEIEHKQLITSTNSSNMNKMNDSINQNNININKSSNLEDKVKVKKFNFNNNINIKKFISNSNSATGQVHKEREKQYAVEIEESEIDPVLVGNSNSKK